MKTIKVKELEQRLELGGWVSQGGSGGSGGAGATGGTGSGSAGGAGGDGGNGGDATATIGVSTGSTTTAPAPTDNKQ